MLRTSSAALETQPTTDHSINADEEQQLARLMGGVHMGIGTELFSRRKRNCAPINAVEAHWRGIDVRARRRAATDSSWRSRRPRIGVNDKFVFCNSTATRCTDAEVVHASTFEARPIHEAVSRWNCKDDDFHEDNLMDIIAGFTPVEVLCGVYLTDLRIPRSIVRDRLAPGVFKAGGKHWAPTQDDHI
ncbi:unnamed protein product [Phytophthora lilii]|uniref:Unnamed protein product n=1 Tax=Phytophthora lilii TaxID=2077276 RepID=A0A9W6U1B3_9STRA|nr:unnamed protein product [Phytophthora lilii]